MVANVSRRHLDVPARWFQLLRGTSMYVHSINMVCPKQGLSGEQLTELRPYLE